MRRFPPVRPRSILALALAGTIVLLAMPAAARAQEPPAPPTAPVNQPPLTAEQKRLEERTHEVASQLRCPVCQGLSIEESGSDIAIEMRNVVREQLAEGRSPEEVKDFFVRAYGEWVLLQPRAEGFNLTIYVLPVLMLLGGAALVLYLTRRWTRRPAGTALTPEADPDLAPWNG